MTLASALKGLDYRQRLKLLVYGLLLVNFVLYVHSDLEIAQFTMRNGGGFLEWTAAFATTLDLTGWFILLLLFELETSVLSDEVLTRPGVLRLSHGIRGVCYILLAHSVYAFGTIYYELTQLVAIEDITRLCQLIAPDVTFSRNVQYTPLTLENCNTLSSAVQFYFTEPGLVVTDAEGLALDRRLALVDFLEVVFWLLILLTIEVMVRLQDRGITRGPAVTVIKSSKIVLYAALWGFAAWWLSLGHLHYAWDEALWILGFATIEGNMGEWKNEIERDQAGASSG
jgi:hypothetical protein